MLEVRIEQFGNLEPDELKKMPDNGSGKRWASYIRMIHDKKTILLVSDAMQPEGATFRRNLDWIKDALLKAYRCGIEDGATDGKA